MPAPSVMLFAPCDAQTLRAARGTLAFATVPE
jgi:hypothetical protein